MPYQMCHYCNKNVEEKCLIKIPSVPAKALFYEPYDDLTPTGSTAYSWTFVCSSCYFDKYCIFCKPPELRENCPGHGITVKKGNRFVEDKKFVKEMMFDEDK